MRVVAISLSMLLAMAAPAAMAQPLPAPTALSPAIETCIRDNAKKVEAAIPDLDKAVEYLVADVCAVPVADEQAREAQAAIDAQEAKMKAVCEKRKASAKTAEDEDYLCDSDLDFSGASWAYSTAFSSIINAPPGAKGLAAQLLLDLRLSHAKPGAAH
jgi:hypothetical protein